MENPIDLALLAGLYVLKSKNDFQKAGDYKRKLARLCFERGYSKKSIRVLLTFVSYLIALPEEAEAKYKKQLNDQVMERKAMIEENPIASQAVEIILFGASLEERDKVRDRLRLKEALRLGAWRLHKAGVPPETIANSLEIPLSAVRLIIKAFTETPPKPVRKRTTWNPDEYWFETVKDYKAYLKEQKAKKMEPSES